MNENEIKEQAKKVENSIKRTLRAVNVKKEKIKILEPVIKNVAWMQIKLDDARETIKHSQIAIQYNNGGGQSGVRENPLFKGYEALWKSYMAGMNKIIEAMPEEKAIEIAEPVERPRTVLSLIQDKHG